MHELKAEGVPLGALAMIVVDNPMAAATGHRICNDCMKACIYQKQEPVDIPAGRDAHPQGRAGAALGLRDLWPADALESAQPARSRCQARVAASKVLVVGLGPAGFTLAHYLLNDGHTVVGIDGLKIEPLPAGISGRDARRRTACPSARSATSTELHENLDDRVMAGFGGVAEYGITVRWDKNFLKIIRLLLERRAPVSPCSAACASAAR